MTNFKVGQKVVCVNDIGWYTDTTGKVTDGPKYNEVVKIDGIEIENGEPMLVFKIYSNEGYQADQFKPLQYKSSSSEILAKFPLTEEKADVQIKEVPQKQTI